MALEPTDGVEVPDKLIEDLEKPKTVPSEPGSEPSEQTPETQEPETEVSSDGEPEEGKEKVPYHKDPQVQLYIERQVAKRIGEGREAYEKRLNRLEKVATQPKTQDITIGGWKPGNAAEAQAARAIILQAKKEMAQELQTLDSQDKERVAAEDRDFSGWLGELRTTEVLKDDKDEIEFARLIAEYKLEDKKAAVALWTRLKEAKAKAKEEGEEEGEEKGKKKAQEAKVGSSRKTGEPGGKERTYDERRKQEPNFDAIVDREMDRLGY